jgi:hypothetical protein
LFEICRIWLFTLGAAMALAGTAMVLLVGFRPLEPVLRLLDRPFWRSGPDETTRRFESWSYSVTFATMAGWGVCIASIAASGFPTKQVWAWWAVAAGLILWYPLDTGRSIYHRVYVNAALNTALLAAAAIPLLLTYGEFR